MQTRSTLKKIILACALVSAACGSDKKDRLGNDDAGMYEEDMDAALPGLVYDEAGQVIGAIDDAGKLVNEAGQVIGAVDDAGNVITFPSTTMGNDGGYVFADGEVPYPVNSTGQVMCGSAVCKCSDGIDNDEPKDGLIDTADPECAAGWDNDESSLATGIPGDNRDLSCQDCFFDGNSGSGNDGCFLPTSCITQGTAGTNNSNSCNSCDQGTKCINFCQAFAPNGCDCFGCCEIRVAGTIKYLQLGSQCDIGADGTMTGSCNQCVQNTTCVNKCGDCELCAGKTVADLPAKCFTQPSGGDAGTSTGNDGGTSTPGADGGSTTPPVPSYQCENGEQVCGANLPACPFGDACSFGCCVRAPILM